MAGLFPLSAQRKTKVRVLPRFPARVEGGAGVAVTRSSGVYTFDLDFASLTPIAALEDDDKFVVERADGSFAYIRNDDMPTGSGSSDMEAATYDPQNIADDAFDRANHTGTQTLSTISDAGTMAAETAADYSTAAEIASAYQPLDPDLTLLAAPTAWRVFYSNGASAITELALGADGTFLKSNGSTSAPSFATPAGSGDVSKVGTPVDGQIGVWTGDGTIEGDAALTFDTTTDSLVIAASGNLLFGAVTVLDDAAGTMTLSNIDALDATTEATIETAIDTLANLTSVQGLAITLADAGADALLGWDDSASAYQNLSAADARTALGLATDDSPQFTAVNIGAATDTTITRVSAGVIAVEGVTILTTATGQPLDSDLTSWAGVTRASGFDTFAATPSSANLRSLLSDEVGTGAAYFVGGALGTPASATLTNATGLPLTGLTGDTTTALGIGSINLGHASDTTIARVSAGVVSIEGVNIVMTGGALGTPSSGTATNLTGLPAAGVTNTALVLSVENQGPITGGAEITSKSLGTVSSGTTTLDMADRALQHYTNNGAHTLAPGTVVGAALVDITNGASAGAITTSGWTKVSGDSFTTTNAHKFRCHASVGNGGSLLVVQAFQ